MAQYSVLESKWLHSNPCSITFCELGLVTASTALFQFPHLLHNNREVGSAWNEVVAYLLNEERLSHSYTYKPKLKLKLLTSVSILYSLLGL